MPPVAARARTAGPASLCGDRGAVAISRITEPAAACYGNAVKGAARRVEAVAPRNEENVKPMMRLGRIRRQVEAIRRAKACRNAEGGVIAKVLQAISCGKGQHLNEQSGSFGIVANR